MLVATAMLKMEKPNEARIKGKRLPFNSENGAQRIGPVAKLNTRVCGQQRFSSSLCMDITYPNTYKDVPSVATTEPTPNFCCMAPVVALKIELPNADVRVVKPNIAAVRSFFFRGPIT